MLTLLSILLIIIALVAGFAVGALRTRAAAKKDIEQARAETELARKEAERARSDAERARIDAAGAEASLEAERRHNAEALKQQAESAKQQADALRTEFRAIATELAQREGHTLRQQHINSLEALLKPLGQDIATFREQFIKGNADVGRHIHDLIEQTTTMGREAEDLARALRGNNKVQGNWGEAVLANLLETAGLTEGRDYTVQAHTRDDEGRNLIPDVVVQLPADRALIIDSKVSLTAFVDYNAADNPDEQARLLHEHVASVRRHVNELAKKNYDKVVKNSIGYVLMFIPSEAAYITAVNADPELTTEAYSRRVILLNPTNLLMALQLTYNLWQSELQSRSVSEIYASAERLYKKFANFAKNFTAIGRSIQSLSKTYEDAEKQLTTGRGNIVAQLEGWKKKGLTPAAEIPEALIKDEDAEEEEAAVPEEETLIAKTEEPIVKEAGRKKKKGEKTND